ncbi:MAG TPA: phosphomannomutase/phosphoglucomutase [Lachnospiraceae bacterium]|nr:phosphomannomutase/phosphoglucomutase [Lachnospiraceae bacterium]
MNQYAQLQNGSDVRGIAISTDAGAATMTEDMVARIAYAFARFIDKKTQKEAGTLRIGVGYDSRLTSEAFARACLQGIRQEGACPVLCGLVSTPSMFMSTKFEETDFDGAVMVTASHLPFNRNGLKFFSREAGLEKDDIREILDMAAKADLPDERVGEDFEKADLIGCYTRHIASLIKREVNAPEYDKPLQGLHIVVDAGNGSCGFFASRILAPLGADIAGSQYLQPDGHFPNHIPNPEDKEAIASLQACVLASQADMGIIFDCDGDRSAVVFADGREVNRNRLIALMAAILSEKNPGTTVVTDSVTSDGLTEFLEGQLGMHHHRFKRGYKNVINEAVRLNGEGQETCLAIETSGHGALKENYFSDDGAYMATLILCALARHRKAGKDLSELIQSLKEPAESVEYRLAIRAEDFRGYGMQVLEALEKYVEQTEGFTLAVPNHEGIRVNVRCDGIQGWFLLRMSLHEPLLPLNIETEQKGGADRIYRQLKEFLGAYTELILP